MPGIYRIVLQDICKRQRFWWRRVQFTFPLVINQPTYDLSVIMPAANPNLAEVALDEVTKFSLVLTPNPLQMATMTAIFDPEAIVEMILNTSPTSPSSGNPNAPGGRYTIGADNDYHTLRIDPPDMAYTAFMVGWGMPNPATDSANDKVPLIPPWGHNTIVDGICREIFAFAYGEDHPRTLYREKKYELGLQDLMMRKQFDPNYRSQLSLSESAIQST
jgi:hypothetical protein